MPRSTQPRYEFEGAVARVILEVREGPQFTVQRRHDSAALAALDDVRPDHGAAGGDRAIRSCRPPPRTRCNIFGTSTGRAATTTSASPTS